MEKRTESATCSTERQRASGYTGISGYWIRTIGLSAFLISTFFSCISSAQTPSLVTGATTPFDKILSTPGLEAGYLGLVRVEENNPRVTSKRQRYTVPIGFFPSLFFRFGYWERQDTLCQSFIGRSLIPPMRHDGVQQDDLNWFLAPADSMSCVLLSLAISNIRGSNPEKGFFYFPSDQPCMCYSKDGDTCLSLEAENTPSETMFSLIDAQLFPAGLENRTPVDAHPGIKRLHPCIGVYGPLCADYTHHGRPEIHPYHWIWYLAPPDSGHLRWLAAHLPDKSGRFRKWAPDTLSGAIRIPIFCPERVQICVTEANGTRHLRDIGPIGKHPLELMIPVHDGSVHLTVCGPNGNEPGYVELDDRTRSGRLFEIITPLCP